MGHSTVPDPQKIADVLRRTRETLHTAEFALDTLNRESPGERRVAAMRNVIVFGRAVTNVLQGLRSATPDFDTWYKPHQQEMAGDPLLKYVYNLRSEILKQGKTSTTSSTHIRFFTSADLPPRPANAVGFVMGDQYGGSGWRVRLEDGTIEMHYVILPESQVRTWLSFRDLPDTHLGKPIGDNTIENVCWLYVQYLQRLIAAAESHFGSAA